MGGSGGGSAGATSWPTYLQDIHNAWLDSTGVDTLTNSMTDAMNAAYGSSPYSADVAYNPDAELSTAWSAVAAFNSVVDALNHTTDYAAAFTQAKTSVDGIIDSTYITNDAAAFSNILEDEITNNQIPSLKAGMLNIGAVHSSAFTLGESIIRAFKVRDVAKYTTDLKLRSNLQRNELVSSGAKEIIGALLKRNDLEAEVARLSIETKRITIVAKKEEDDTQREIDAHDALWDLQTFQYGGNLIASISGGIGPVTHKPSKMQSAIGGALSGGAAGAIVGTMVTGISPLAGAAAGGLLGIGGAFL